MLVLAVAFAVVLLLPRIVDVGPGTERALGAAMWFIWAAFVFEYLMLPYLAPDRWQMVRTHVLDLVIILVPFLRPLRALRVLRLLLLERRAS